MNKMMEYVQALPAFAVLKGQTSITARRAKRCLRRQGATPPLPEVAEHSPIRVLPIRARVREGLPIPQVVDAAVMEIQPFGLCKKPLPLHLKSKKITNRPLGGIKIKEKMKGYKEIKYD
ncbi:MAG: hypothetical protein LBU76_05980 [Azoarcus sp.]|jgi:hypothetical protein|nr:hypothetical protein [Azoarcus sp.]